jgi:Zn-dependent protease with chaperone function
MSGAVFKGEYHDGVSSNAHAVDVTFADGNFIIQDDQFAKSAPIKAIQVSERLGRLPRTLTLPDGSLVVLPDSISLSRQLQEGSSYLQKLESNAIYAGAGVLLLIACLWGFYVALLPWLSDTLAREISIEMEEKLSNGTLENMDVSKVWKASSLNENQQVAIRSQLVERLGSFAMKSVQLQFRESAFFGANALALPGSKIIVTDKLVQILSGDELAAVVAHELGHLHHKHNARMLVRQAGLSGVLDLLLGFQGVNKSIAGTAQTLGQAKYSREFEAEADAYSTELMKAANLSPCLLGSALLKLEKVTPVEPGSHTSWFASHPPTQVRIHGLGNACAKADIN